MSSLPSRIVVAFWIPFVVGAAAGVAAPNELALEVFVRNDAEVCRAGEKFARDFVARRPGLRLVVRDVVADREALARYWRLIEQCKIAQPGLPAFYCCNQLQIGFDDAARSGPEMEAMLTLTAYVRAGCPHCSDAKRFLAGLQRRWPALRVEQADVVRDADARRRMEEAVRRYDVRIASLPVIVFGGHCVTGYQNDAVSGARIEAWLQSSAVGPETKTNGKRGAPGRGSSAVAGLALWRAAALGPWPAATMLLAADDVTGAEKSSVAPPPREQTSVAPPPPPTDAVVPPPPPPGDATGPAIAEPDVAPPDEVVLPLFGRLRLSDWGLPLFTLIIGLVDGFNPCAMWVLVFLLSVLVNVRSRARILAVAGTFVLISGLAYFAFMAAWLNVFALIGFIRPLQIALGLVALCIGVINVKDFAAFKRGVSLSIPESAKPGIYARVRQIVSAQYLHAAVGAAVVLAIAVNVVELLCTAGLPALYGEILTLQRLPAWQNYAYLALYNLAYMFDDSLLLAGFVVTLSHRKLQQREGRWLKLVNGLVISALGLTMIFRPDWLHFGAG